MKYIIPLSPYIFTWAIIAPVKGKPTKRDINKLFKGGIYTIGSHNTNIFIAWFKDKNTAIEKLSKKFELYKQYTVYLMSDKQFGLVKWNENPIEFLTKKQLSEKFLIN